MKVGDEIDSEFGRIMFCMTDTVDCISFFACIPEKNVIIATAECSRPYYVFKNVYYFNRLLVKPPYRKHGYGTIILQMLLDCFKERNLIIELDISPYPEAMNYVQLEKFYIKHGFVKTTIPDKSFRTVNRYYFNAFMPQEVVSDQGNN